MGCAASVVVCYLLRLFDHRGAVSLLLIVMVVAVCPFTALNSAASESYTDQIVFLNFRQQLEWLCRQIVLTPDQYIE